MVHFKHECYVAAAYRFWQVSHTACVYMCLYMPSAVPCYVLVMLHARLQLELRTLNIDHCTFEHCWLLHVLHQIKHRLNGQNGGHGLSGTH